MNALTLPDIAAQASQQSLPLDWVGMCGIALPLRLEDQTLSATADAGVDLSDGQSRGIHMSRLYLALEAFQHEPLTASLMRRVLRRFLDSHEGLSTEAHLTLRFDLLLERPALKSPESGHKRYPIVLNASLSDEMFHVELSAEVVYSSTCPCSAALARQLIQEQFLTDFANRALSHEDVLGWLGSPQGIVATPHSQRSTARIRVRLNEKCEALPMLALINQAEAALGTAVQTAVKRADEQAFALANGQNLMFCEDAARRLHVALKAADLVDGFDVRIEHAESLHAHDAVAHTRWNWRP